MTFDTLFRYSGGTRCSGGAESPPGVGCSREKGEEL